MGIKSKAVYFNGQRISVDQVETKFQKKYNGKNNVLKAIAEAVPENHTMACLRLEENLAAYENSALIVVYKDPTFLQKLAIKFLELVTG